MSGRHPEERVRLPVLHQRWRQVLMLHWSYPAEVVAELLPDQLVPDLHDGTAWVSLTPFRAEGTRLPGAPSHPLWSDFPETNLRTYVRGPGDVDGLWFFTLEVGSVPTALAGRLAVPYRRADMSVTTEGPVITCESRRRSDPRIGHRIRARRLEPLGQHGLLDDWLTGRWRAWTRRAGHLATVPVRHQPWPLHAAELLECDESLLAAHGLPPADEAPLVHASPGVDARLGLPRLR